MHTVHTILQARNSAQANVHNTHSAHNTTGTQYTFQRYTLYTSTTCTAHRTNCIIHNVQAEHAHNLNNYSIEKANVNNVHKTQCTGQCEKYTIRYIHCTLQRSIISTSHYLHFGKLTHLTSYNCIDVYQSHLDFCLYSMFEHLSALHLYCI